MKECEPNLGGDSLPLTPQGQRSAHDDENERATILTAVALIGLYVGSYAVLSFRGQYVPGGWGVGWVKFYIWAPQGFVSGPTGTEQHRVLQCAYLPLWQIDWRFIHTPEKAGEGRHPINTTLDDALQKRLHQIEQNQASQAIGAEDALQPER